MKKLLILVVMVLLYGITYAQYHFDKPLYGVAYYSEYAPTDRLQEDIKLMKDAGTTVVRIGESAWGIFEPQEGVFEFEWMDRIVDSLAANGIKIIFGTPTYSIPLWMADKYPEVLSIETNGRQRYYGIRQNMDFYNEKYRFFC